MNRIVHGDNLLVLRTTPSESVDLIYIDPPFNTGKTQIRHRISTVRDDAGDRTGFGGKRYKTIKVGTTGYIDFFSDYLDFLAPRLAEAHRVLTDTGSLFFHIDYREAHYCKIVLDQIFGRESFQNEIIWAYDYGARSKTKWPAKHDSILWYSKNPDVFTFNLDASDRIPYMAPDLVGPEKAARGKTPTDVWWHTIVPTNGKEKTGYATQKPLGVVERIIKVHSNPGDLCMDFFAGSGTLGEAAAKNERQFLLVDISSDAIAVMERRLSKFTCAKESARIDNRGRHKNLIFSEA
jgi:site-specific DNA-methyltransferase (adenine-specific)